MTENLPIWGDDLRIREDLEAIGRSIGWHDNCDEHDYGPMIDVARQINGG